MPYLSTGIFSGQNSVGKSTLQNIIKHINARSKHRLNEIYTPVNKNLERTNWRSVVHEARSTAASKIITVTSEHHSLNHKLRLTHHGDVVTPVINCTVGRRKLKQPESPDLYISRYHGLPQHILAVNFPVFLQFPIHICFSNTVSHPGSYWHFLFFLWLWILTHDLNFYLNNVSVNQLAKISESKFMHFTRQTHHIEPIALPGPLNHFNGGKVYKQHVWKRNVLSRTWTTFSTWNIPMWRSCSIVRSSDRPVRGGGVPTARGRGSQFPKPAAHNCWMF